MDKYPLKLFYSYSHKDEDLRISLETHLAILKRKGEIDEWHDRKITSGREWEDVIDKKMEESNIILLLISPDFIASDYCYGKEMTCALKKHELQQARVIPIIIRPVDWKDAPFSKLQCLPKDVKPITSWENNDEAWLHVAKEIRIAIDEVRKELKRKEHPSGFKNLKILIRNEFERIEKVFERKKLTHFTGLSTGYKELDFTIDGLHSGDLIVIASKPPMSNSELALNIVKNIAVNEDSPVAFFSLRLSSEHLARMLLSLTSKVHSERILKVYLHQSDWPSITSAAGMLSDAPIFVDDNSNLSLENIKNRIIDLKKNSTMSIVIIDGIQNLSDTIISNTSPAVIAKSIKQFAKEINIPIIVTTQITGHDEHEMNKKPSTMDLNKWAILEDIADVLMFIHKSEDYGGDFESRKEIAEIIIAKNNYGATRDIRLSYFPESKCIEDVQLESEDESAESKI